MRKHTTPLRNLRRARTISQADLAKMAGISQQHLSKFERGMVTPSADMQALLATILGAAVDQLFDTEPKQAVSA